MLTETPDTPEIPSPTGLPSAPPAVSLDGPAYRAGVSETLERILSGTTYQLNLSTRFTWDCPDLDSLSLFRAMRAAHPAPFYAWMTSGPYRVLSTSPERFLRVEDGEVLSQPIKGTLRFDRYAPELEKELTGSPKESAELSMIVDLIRNDISTHCEYGSVTVDSHKSVFAVDSLLQMYANVRGTLRQAGDCLDLFFDAFPGGSVTGCPKHSSMTIIEELEPHKPGRLLRLLRRHPGRTHHGFVHRHPHGGPRYSVRHAGLLGRERHRGGLGPGKRVSGDHCQS